MDAQRWATVQEILDHALDLLPDRRPAYLDEACGGDRALRSEVEALIAAVDGGLELTSAVTTAEPEELGPGSALQDGRYRILAVIGRGGMGEVYKARDTRLDRDVSIKRLLLTDERARAVFTREAHLLARLKHPRLPTVTDSFFEHGRAFFVMEYVPGRDLWDALNARFTPFDADTVRDWAVQVLETLDYLHTYRPPEGTIREAELKPIVHRDIKPSNLKLHPNGRLYLLDFGIAQSGVLDLTRTAGPSSGLTPHYAPPEQFDRRAETTARSDLFALGATLYTLLTGDRPPKAETRMAVVKDGFPDPLKPVHESRPDVPRAFSELIFRAMALDPRQRPASAAAMLDALRHLDAILEAPTVPSRPSYPHTAPPSVPNGGHEPPPRRRMLVASALVILVLAALAYFFYPFGDDTARNDGTPPFPSDDTLAVHNMPPADDPEHGREPIDPGSENGARDGSSREDDSPREDGSSGGTGSSGSNSLPANNDDGDSATDPGGTDPDEQVPPRDDPGQDGREEDPQPAAVQVRANFLFRDAGNDFRPITRGSIEIDGRRLSGLANQTLSAGNHCFRVRQDGYIPIELRIDGARVPFEGASSVCVDVPASTSVIKVFIDVKRE